VLVGTCRPLGWRVEVNCPYAGTLILIAYCRRDARVSSVMTAVNCSLYLKDEPRDVSKSVAWDRVLEGVRTLVTRAVEVL
jgi:N-formylglutamate amidohydrolase